MLGSALNAAGTLWQHKEKVAYGIGALENAYCLYKNRKSNAAYQKALTDGPELSSVKLKALKSKGNITETVSIITAATFVGVAAVRAASVLFPAHCTLLTADKVVCASSSIRDIFALAATALTVVNAASTEYLRRKVISQKKAASQDGQHHV